MSMKICFIGAGGISTWHLEHLNKIKAVKAAAICDIVKERAVNVSKKYGVAKVYEDHHEMIKREKPDGVYICLPPYAHTDQEILLIKNKIPFFVEKPIHISLKHSKTIERLIEKNNVITSIGYQGRYQDIMDKMKEFIKSRQPGMVIGYWLSGLYCLKGTPMGDWWGIKAKSGGQIVEQTTHIFDEIRYLFGEVKEVSAFGNKADFLVNYLKHCDIEDASAVNLKFKSGLIGTILSNCFASYGCKAGIDIYLQDSTIEYKERSSIKILEKNRSTEISVGNDIGQVEDEVFINAIKTGNPGKIRSTYSDAVKTLALTLAANKSIATGEMVKL